MKYRSALVVDDDAGTRDTISDAVQRAGFEVSTAARGRTALAHLDDVQPDLVVLELTLPDIDGLEVCRRIRSSSDCYIVFVSERQDEIDLLLGLEAGADDFMGKPVSPRELQARIAALFRRPRSSSASPGPRASTATAASRVEVVWSSTATPATSRSTGSPSSSPAPSSTCSPPWPPGPVS